MLPSFLFSLFVSFSSSVDPEADMTVMQIIKYWGYPVQKIDVFTDDGFILDLYRIPAGRKGLSAACATPVLLVPGLSSSSAAFVQNPPESSPAMILADAGFDVFLFNYRGTRYGRRHVRLSPNESEFWQYSLDHHANLDSPAVVDAILEVTGASSLFWIGHSQGSIVGFMFLADNPHYNRKVKAMFHLAPVGTAHYSRGIVQLGVIVYRTLEPLLDWYRTHFGAHPIGNQHQWVFRLLAQQICEAAAVLSSGPPSPNFNRTRQPVYFSHFPDGTSTWTVDHYGQIGSRNAVRHFEPVPTKTASAPYDYGNIAAPSYLFWSNNDYLTPPEEIALIILPSLRTGVVKATFEVPHYNHLDFVLATDCAAKVYNIIITIMRSHELSL